MCDIDLRLIALFGPAFFLKFGVKENSGVTAWSGLHICLELKVLEFFFGKEMRTLAGHDNRALFHFPGAVLGDPPTRQIFSIE